MSCRTDLFVEINNITKGKTVWPHFTMTGYYPTSIQLSRPILKENVIIDTYCCIFKCMIVDWTNIEVMSISGIKIDMPTEAMISIFTDNDLTHIGEDQFEINLIACLLNQIYVVPPPIPPPRYNDMPQCLSLIHISEPTRRYAISYAVFCLKKKK